MKVTANREQLLDNLKRASAACPARSTKPALQMVRLDAEVGMPLKISATDGEIGIVATLLPPAEPPTETHRSGSVLIQPGKLLMILRELKDAAVGLEDTPAGTVVTGAGASFTLPGGNPDDLPRVTAEPSSEKPQTVHTVAAGPLRVAVKRATEAVEKSDTVVRYAVNGVLWATEDGKLTLVGTDTKRMAVAHCQCSSGGAWVDNGGKASIVPHAAMKIILDAIPEDDAVKVTFFMDDETSDFVLDTGATLVRARLLSGKYPPWGQIVPKSSAVNYTLDRKSLLKAIKQVSAMGEDDAKKIGMYFANGELTLRSDSSSASGESTMPAKDGTAKFEANFNPKYLADYLRSETADEVRMEGSSGEKPIVFRVAVDFNADFFLVMPLTG